MLGSVERFCGSPPYKYDMGSLEQLTGGPYIHVVQPKYGGICLKPLGKSISHIAKSVEKLSDIASCSALGSSS